MKESSWEKLVSNYVYTKNLYINGYGQYNGYEIATVNNVPTGGGEFSYNVVPKGLIPSGTDSTYLYTVDQMFGEFICRQTSNKNGCVDTTPTGAELYSEMYTNDQCLEVGSSFRVTIKNETENNPSNRNKTITVKFGTGVTQYSPENTIIPPGYVLELLFRLIDVSSKTFNVYNTYYALS